MKEYKFGSMTEHYDEWILKAIPETTLSAIERYVQRGIPVGSFLQAVIRHDLFEAVGRADESNLHALREIVMLFYNYTPGSCHGSKAHYQAWIDHCGLLNNAA
jgi:hypothetical protein